MIIWITGLSGVGKTTIGGALIQIAKDNDRESVFLDGDAVRLIVDDKNVGHDKESRLINAKRISRLAQYLESQNLMVVVSTMSLFHEIHQWNRLNFKTYFEVLIESDFQKLQKNDDKGIYGKAKSGEIKNVVGYDIAPEKPISPDFTLQNDYSLSPSQLAQLIYDKAFEES